MIKRSFFCLVLLCVALWGYATPTTDYKMTLQPVSFTDLPGWEKDKESEAFKAFQVSCHRFLTLRPDDSVGTSAMMIKAKQWWPICRTAMQLKNPTDSQARVFFQQHFNVYTVFNLQQPQGLVTAYYLPEVQVSHTRHGSFTVPIYSRPKDLITVKMGLFSSVYKGRKLSGKVVGTELYPYDSREEINKGSLKGRVSIIAWGNSYVDRFFLQIQGSGEAVFPDGKKELLGYDGENGRSYISIGKLLVDSNTIAMKDMSAQTLKKWLNSHPKKGAAVMEANPSFIFFRVLKQKNPNGTARVPLTPWRSVAVDQHYIPLGSPMWFATDIPLAKFPLLKQPFKHLMVAQDTGGAIRGPIRADLYLGAGSKAEIISGHMVNKGRYWLMLPKSFAIPKRLLAVESVDSNKQQT